MRIIYVLLGHLFKSHIHNLRTSFELILFRLNFKFSYLTVMN